MPLNPRSIAATGVVDAWLPGPASGFGIDASLERTIHTAPAGRTRITLSPLLVPTRQGVLVSQSF